MSKQVFVFLFHDLVDTPNGLCYTLLHFSAADLNDAIDQLLAYDRKEKELLLILGLLINSISQKSFESDRRNEIEKEERANSLFGRAATIAGTAERSEMYEIMIDQQKYSQFLDENREEIVKFLHDAKEYCWEFFEFREMKIEDV